MHGCKRNDSRTLRSRFRRRTVQKTDCRSGQGKRSGFRTLVATNKGDCWFFVFGFPKNERSNINKKEEEALKMLASVLLS
ncbi:MAG: type II toxin-antitoxin system RelE/ParE family toxin [Nostoc sp.]